MTHDSSSFDPSLFARRRTALLDTIGTDVAVFPAAPVFIRNNDVEHSYRQDSDLWYLTGFEEPDSVLVVSGSNAKQQSVLFVRPRNPERETWDGPRAGVTGAVERYGVDAAYPIGELKERLPGLLIGARQLHYRAGQGHPFDGTLFEALNVARRRTVRNGQLTPSAIVDTSSTVHEQRLRKDDAEIDAIRAAAALTAEAHTRAMVYAQPGMFEYEVEAEMLHLFRRSGSRRVAYDSIVGSGRNATILHYRENQKRIDAGDLLLIDAGCELNYYASDVTRTFPVGRRFTTPERILYEVVLRAQKAAIAAVKPGASTASIHEVAARHLTEGFIEHGLLQATVEEAMEDELYKAYYMHRTGHWLGMDVHDVGAYCKDGKSRPFEEGMVLTIEPGVYIAEDDESVSAQWRGIGIRIEDDILVTAEGHENLTAAIPKEVDAIEALTTQASEAAAE